MVCVLKLLETAALSGAKGHSVDPNFLKQYGKSLKRSGSGKFYI